MYPYLWSYKPSSTISRDGQTHELWPNSAFSYFIWLYSRGGPHSDKRSLQPTKPPIPLFVPLFLETSHQPPKSKPATLSASPLPCSLFSFLQPHFWFRDQTRARSSSKLLHQPASDSEHASPVLVRGRNWILEPVEKRKKKQGSSPVSLAPAPLPHRLASFLPPSSTVSSEKTHQISNVDLLCRVCTLRAKGGGGSFRACLDMVASPPLIPPPGVC